MSDPEQYYWTLACVICGYSWTTRRAYSQDALWYHLGNLPTLPCGHRDWGGIRNLLDVKEKKLCISK